MDTLRYRVHFIPSKGFITVVSIVNTFFNYVFLLIPFGHSISEKLFEKSSKIKCDFNEIDILEDSKMSSFSDFVEIARSFLSFTDSDMVTAWMRDIALQ